MKKEALSLFGHGDLILFSFLLFFVTFIGVLIWAFRKNQVKFYNQMASMHLEKVKEPNHHE
ncbi:MAG: hypothetical protein CL678_08020 [Bdellovibrionaceae bacterium]|nr:hypothetical protein [Pseudobdellovibrionaceae bacterium]